MGLVFSVEAALDAHVAANASIHPPDGKYHPSGMFGCLRKAVYSVRGEEPSDPRGAQSHRTLFIGSRWHEIIQAAVANHAGADEVYTEVPVELPHLNIVGHADQLVRFGDEWEMCEYKSISQRGFDYARKMGDLPKADHIQQAMVYMYALRTVGATVDDPMGVEGLDHLNLRPLGDALKSVRFCYIAKDDLRIAEFVVPWDPTFEDKIKEQVAILNAYLADPISLPARLPMMRGKKHWMCGGAWGKCEFYTRCWNRDPAEVPADPDVY